MKCPKCGYIGFEASDRCRNCGYDFSLVPPPPSVPDLPLRSEGSIGPLPDLTLNRDAEAPSSPASRRQQEDEFNFDRFPAPSSTRAADLPLFDAAPAPPNERPLVTAVPPPRPPLAVRRSTPPSPRVRTPPLRSQQVALDLRIEPGPEPEPQAVEPAATSAVAAASVGRRVAAGLVDLAILLPANLVVIYFTLRLCRLSVPEVTLLPPLPLLLFFLILDGGYLLAFTAAAGQTIGQMAFGLKVVTGSGERVGLGRALARTAACLISVVPAGLGLLPAAFDAERRTLHDRLADTRVIAIPAS